VSFTVLQDDNFFIRLKSSDQKKENYVVFEVTYHNLRHETQSKDPCDHVYKNSVSRN